MKCEHKIPLTKEEEEQMNKTILAILMENYALVRKRFPNINDLTTPEEDTGDSDSDGNDFK